MKCLNKNCEAELDGTDFYCSFSCWCTGLEENPQAAMERMEWLKKEPVCSCGHCEECFEMMNQDKEVFYNQPV
jgi:hypothetical protein